VRQRKPVGGVRKKCRCLDDVGPPQRTDKLCVCAHVKATIDRSSRLATTVSFQHNSMHHHQAMVVTLTCLSVVSCVRDCTMDGSMCRSCGTQHAMQVPHIELCIQASAVVALFSSRVGTHATVYSIIDY
jgi:hypothetical protein